MTYLENKFFRDYLSMLEQKKLKLMIRKLLTKTSIVEKF